jgi:molybdopterin-binding protein
VSLDARVTCRIGELDLDVRLQCGDGEVVAVLGPNGAGKTTLLRALAADGTAGVVFQDLLLFPHLTVLGNVAFGLRARGVARRAAEESARNWLHRLGLGDLAHARPAALSGGQAQSVAMARALAVEPSLVLLDEPLSALDAGARPAVRRHLKRALDDFAGAAVLVTHDPVDAATLAHRVVVLEAGRVVQEGRLDEVTARPRSRYVADLVGVNLLRGVVRDDRLLLEGAEVAVAGAPDGEAFAVVHPRAVALHRTRPVGSARNLWQGRVTAIDHEGARCRVVVDGPVALVAEVTPAAVAELELHEGARVWCAVKATEVAVHPS